MDKHDKHHKPGKSRAKPAAAAGAKTEAPALEANEKSKGDWPGKSQNGGKSK